MADSPPEQVVCVFCGASSGKLPIYEQSADRLAEVFAGEGWGLVYGGGTTGIMGAVAKGMASRGAWVHGVIPRALIEREAAGHRPDPKEYGHTTVVEDMHTRKRLMGQQATAFVSLPGGFGTAEELFEITTWNQLGIHSRPVILVNIDGFYDGFVDWINKAIDAGFIREGNRGIVVTVNTPEEALEAVKNYEVANDRYNLTWDAQSPVKTK